MSELFIAFILGVIEGVTEFLPVSSTGHMILVGHLLGFEGQKAASFEVMIQLGSILAVVFIFWRRMFGLIGLHFGQKTIKNQPHLNLIHIILGMIPAVILGLTFHSVIKSLFSPQNVMYALILGGGLLLLAEWLRPRHNTQTLDEITYTQALVIGLFQCLALWPGFSRSGATIAGGLLLGVNRQAATEYSFILAVPMMIGATGLDFYKSYHFLSSTDIPLFAIGFITAFFTALIAIKTFLTLIQHISFIPFAIYRFFVAIAVYWILL